MEVSRGRCTADSQCKGPEAGGCLSVSKEAGWLWKSEWVRERDVRDPGEMGIPCWTLQVTETLDFVLSKMEASRGLDSGGIGADLCFSLGYNGGGEKWLDSGHVQKAGMMGLLGRMDTEYVRKTG